MFELRIGKQHQQLFISSKFNVLICFALVFLSGTVCFYQKPPMGKYLYMASIQYRFNETYCTGAIIEEVLVLTTCDCVATFNQLNKTWYNRPPSRIVVSVGILDLFTDLRTGQLRLGKAIWKHPNCKLKSTERDWTNLAIIQVDRPFLFTEFYENVAQPMELFALWQAFKLKSLLIFMSHSPPKECYAVGWGFTKDNTSVPTSQMQEISLTLKRKCFFDECEMEYCKANYSMQPNICGQLGAKQCGGFKGNLLVCFGKVYGLVSIPSKCYDGKSNKKVPTVFVRMDEGLPFIWAVLKHLGYSRGSFVSPQEFQFLLLSALIILYFKCSRILEGSVHRDTYPYQINC